ncbi:MAG TPA: 50S ribosomal protein L21 [Planctomycetaceae bacterium]|nr:50S ribosomal protein L21 [Planctomycetaceae bacterium]HRF00606.1 50S ribosomal protein L21 [Pirellulaceae bacterium]
MYAIIADSGKQFKVEEGLTLEIDLRDVAEGDKITFDRVLAVSSEGNFRLGQPTVAGASVQATVVGMVKGPKLVVQKFRRRKNSRRKTGHRQKYTKVVIEKIVA